MVGVIFIHELCPIKQTTNIEMNKKFISLILLNFILMELLYSGNICNIMFPQDSNEWGIGLCYIPKDFRINVYIDNNVEPVGTIERNLNGKILLNLINEPENFKIDYNDFIWAGHYDIFMLKTYEFINGNYLRIFNQTSSSGFLISMEELINANGNFFTYYDFLIADQKDLPKEFEYLIDKSRIGVNLIESCLNVRMEASVDSDSIICIVNNNRMEGNHIHMEIIEHKGYWLKIKFNIYEIYEGIEDTEGCSYKIKDSNIGWVKAIDENGRPNIWFSVTSY